MREIAIKSLGDLPGAVDEFIAIAEPGRVYAFYGAMGAGKTTFIAALCRRLGSGEEANSPTFSIVNEYDTRLWGRIYHLDCYRLEGEEDAFNTGVEDYFNSGKTCLVEWPGNIGSLLPEDAVTVELEVADDGSRIMRIHDR